MPGPLVLRRQDWREGCERCKQILRYGGMGHTMSIHSQNEQVILEFGLKKPAFRIVVNSPTTHGSIGLTTGLDPAMTLGCGGYGGNITSDNISPRHLLNIKRLAYEITPVVSRWDRAGAATRRPTRQALPQRRRRVRRRRPASAPSAVPADRRVPRLARLQAGGADRSPTGVDDPRRSDADVATGRRRPASPPSRSRRSTSSARKTCGARFRRDESWSCPSARSSRPRRAISAEQHRVFTVAPWRG